jgi:CHAD domain-containing protein
MVHDHRIKGIDCDADTLAGIRKALTERFDDMSRLRQEAIKWKDPEGVHSMRVASRRLRSAVSDFLPYVNKRGFSSFLKQIRSIADALGEVRDQDVAILALEKLESEIPEELSATLQELIKTRKEIRRIARQELKRILVKEHIKDLSNDFEDALNRATELRGAPKASSTFSGSYKDTAKRVIRDRLVELEKLSISLYQPLEATQLHEMRIGAKRLRYSIELFSDCLSDSILPFAKSSARLQTALGRVHDCDVWIQSLRDEILESKKLKQQEQTKTFTWLFTHFTEIRNTHFQAAFSLWEAWETGHSSEKLKEKLTAS